MIQVDAGSIEDGAAIQVEPGERLWIEVTCEGRVVGVVDARAGDDGFSAPTLDKINAAIGDAEPSPDKTLADEDLPRASVIVPTLCRNPDELVRLVESLLGLDYPEFEIILVDNRSNTSTPLPEFPGGDRVKVFEEPRTGASAARNMGIAMATGEVLAFTDDDATVDPNWLRAIGERFANDNEIEGMGGLVLPMILETPAQLWFEEFYGGFSPSFHFEKLSMKLLQDSDKMFPYAVGRFGAGCNMAYRRSTLLRLGGFDVEIGGGTLARGGEDVSVAIQLVVHGGTFAYEPAAVVRHTHRRTEEEFMRQVFNYGVGLTATYSAMIARDPRHLSAMLRRVPVGVRHLVRSPKQRSPSAAPSYPQRALAYQILGMLYGPLAYVRSVSKTRRSANAE
jgi:GT2 family glycosyltransferase